MATRAKKKSEEDEGELCQICGDWQDAHRMLLCDRCNSGFHLYCLDPPLEKVPDGQWMCPYCEIQSKPIIVTLKVPLNFSKGTQGPVYLPNGKACPDNQLNEKGEVSSGAKSPIVSGGSSAITIKICRKRFPGESSTDSSSVLACKPDCTMGNEESLLEPMDIVKSDHEMGHSETESAQTLVPHTVEPTSSDLTNPNCSMEVGNGSTSTGACAPQMTQTQVAPTSSLCYLYEEEVMTKRIELAPMAIRPRTLPCEVEPPVVAKTVEQLWSKPLITSSFAVDDETKIKTFLADRASDRSLDAANVIIRPEGFSNVLKDIGLTSDAFLCAHLTMCKDEYGEWTFSNTTVEDAFEHGKKIPLQVGFFLKRGLAGMAATEQLLSMSKGNTNESSMGVTTLDEDHELDGEQGTDVGGGLPNVDEYREESEVKPMSDEVPMPNELDLEANPEDPDLDDAMLASKTDVNGMDSMIEGSNGGTDSDTSDDIKASILAVEDRTTSSSPPMVSTLDDTMDVVPSEPPPQVVQEMVSSKSEALADPSSSTMDSICKDIGSDKQEVSKWMEGDATSGQSPDNDVANISSVDLGDTLVNELKERIDPKHVVVSDSVSNSSKLEEVVSSTSESMLDCINCTTTGDETRVELKANATEEEKGNSESSGLEIVVDRTSETSSDRITHSGETEDRLEVGCIGDDVTKVTRSEPPPQVDGRGTGADAEMQPLTEAIVVQVEKSPLSYTSGGPNPGTILEPQTDGTLAIEESFFQPTLLEAGNRVEQHEDHSNDVNAPTVLEVDDKMEPEDDYSSELSASTVLKAEDEVKPHDEDSIRMASPAQDEGKPHDEDSNANKMGFKRCLELGAQTNGEDNNHAGERIENGTGKVNTPLSPDGIEQTAVGASEIKVQDGDEESQGAVAKENESDMHEDDHSDDDCDENENGGSRMLLFFEQIPDSSGIITCKEARPLKRENDGYSELFKRPPPNLPEVLTASATAAIAAMNEEEGVSSTEQKASPKDYTVDTNLLGTKGLIASQMVMSMATNGKSSAEGLENITISTAATATPKKIAVAMPKKPKERCFIRSKRCGKCPGCLVKDICGECPACRKKVKFGGDGKTRRGCFKRRCDGLIRPEGAPDKKKPRLTPARSPSTPKRANKRESSSSVSPAASVKRRSLGSKNPIVPSHVSPQTSSPEPLQARKITVSNVRMDLFLPRWFWRSAEATEKVKALLTSLVLAIEQRVAAFIDDSNKRGKRRCPFRLSVTRDAFDFEPVAMVVQQQTEDDIVRERIDWCVSRMDATPEMLRSNKLKPHEQDPEMLQLGCSTYVDVLDEPTLCSVEKESMQVFEDSRKRTQLRPETFHHSVIGRATGDNASVTRTKMFFGARYLWTADQLSEASAKRALGIRTDVYRPPAYTTDVVLPAVAKSGALPKGMIINQVAMNIYHTGTTGIAPHYDDNARFELPVISMRIFSDSRLSFGCRGSWGIGNGEFAIPMPRGSILVLHDDSYASNVVKHCVRPVDMTGRSGVLLFRKIHEQLLVEALEIELEEMTNLYNNWELGMNAKRAAESCIEDLLGKVEVALKEEESEATEPSLDSCPLLVEVGARESTISDNGDLIAGMSDIASSLNNDDELETSIPTGSGESENSNNPPLFTDARVKVGTVVDSSQDDKGSSETPVESSVDVSTVVKDSHDDKDKDGKGSSETPVKSTVNVGFVVVSSSQDDGKGSSRTPVECTGTVVVNSQDDGEGNSCETPLGPNGTVLASSQDDKDGKGFSETPVESSGTVIDSNQDDGKGNSCETPLGPNGTVLASSQDDKDGKGFSETPVESSGTVIDSNQDDGKGNSCETPVESNGTVIASTQDENDIKSSSLETSVESIAESAQGREGASTSAQLITGHADKEIQSEI